MRVSPWLVPSLVVALIAAGVGFSRLFAIPTVELELAASGSRPQASPVTVSLIVDGVRCADTARQAGSTLEGEPGVIRFVAYASHSRVDITYDPAMINRQALVAAIEGPVYDEATGEFRFGVFEVVEPAGGDPQPELTEAVEERDED
jgi:hypothetical protein